MNLDVLQLQEDRALVELRALIDTATKEARGLTDQEKQSCDELYKSLTDIGIKIGRAKGDASFFTALDDLVGGSTKKAPARFLVSRVGAMKTFGQQFVESAAFAWYADPEQRARRSGQWVSPAFELERWALTEGAGSGGGLVPPDIQPGIVSGPMLPVTIADLFMPGVTASNAVSVMREASFTNAAGAVAEGTAKPESALTFELQSEPVRKLAHWIAISEELLEDVPAARSYIDQRMRYGIARVEDYQILLGDGTPPELEGLLARTGLAADVVRTAPESNADAILRAISGIESTTGLPVSGVVLHPSAWASIIGERLTSGEYLAGGPFGSPTAPRIWNREVALTDQITATEGVVGAFKTGAQVFRRGGIRGDLTNSHSDYFTKNLVAVRWEERLALSVTRPAAFAKVTTLTTL